jgi:tRNA dimethylallyltransferase
VTRQVREIREVIVVTGPTAVGKTAVAMALQDQLGGAKHAQLISVDSAMVYRGLDIGTAKPSAVELAQYPHRLIDIRDPGQPYTAADFVADADRCIEQAFAQGQLPILVGGSMLYLKCFEQGIADLPDADPELRAVLQREFDELGGAHLHSELSRLDPRAAQNIHPNNPQRLLRALEVIRLTGKPLSDQWQELGSPPAVERLTAEIATFAILPGDRSDLHQRIAQRFDTMLAAGFEDEIRKLAARADLHGDLPAMRAVGYRQGLQFLAGELNAAEFREQAITATRRLAKRQLTWLRRWPGLRRLDWGDAQELAANILDSLANDSPADESTEHRRLDESPGR